VLEFAATTGAVGTLWKISLACTSIHAFFNALVAAMYRLLDGLFATVLAVSLFLSKRSLPPLKKGDRGGFCLCIVLFYGIFLPVRVDVHF
jgi:hypothetical protein